MYNTYSRFVKSLDKSIENALADLKSDPALSSGLNSKLSLKRRLPDIASSSEVQDSLRRSTLKKELQNVKTMKLESPEDLDLVEGDNFVSNYDELD